MKKSSLLFTICLIVILLVGCKDYLNLPPKNVRAVISLTDAKRVLGGYLEKFALVASSTINSMPGPAVTYTADQISMFNAYSDDIDFAEALVSSYIAPQPTKPESYYANLLLFNDFTTPTTIWNSYYSCVGFTNVLISQIDAINEDNQTLRNQLKGELLIHRAFHIFKLLEYFAPYNDAKEGIPVYLKAGIENFTNPRKSQKEVYQIIINDLEEALKLIAITPPKEGFNIWYNTRYINNLLAQVYWFKAESAAKENDDYKNAKKYALEATKNTDAFIPKTVDDIYKAIQGKLQGYPAYMNSPSMQAGVAGLFGAVYMNYSPTNIKIDTELFNLYSNSDIRYSAYFKVVDGIGTINPIWPDGTSPAWKRGQFLEFQPEEAFLILAEAHYRMNETNESIAVLNRFKSFRNAGTAVGLSGTQLLNEIKNERRKEFFCLKDSRWIALKRYGDVTISREFVFFQKLYSLVVPPNSFRYALPIPLTELAINPDLTDNPGWLPIVF